MGRNDNEGAAIRVIERVQSELNEIEDLTSVSDIKERVRELLAFIKDETTVNKSIFAELINNKVRETKGRYPELNTNLYLLYRNLTQDRITVQEARKLYGMYINEYGRF